MELALLNITLHRDTQFISHNKNFPPSLRKEEFLKDFKLDLD